MDMAVEEEEEVEEEVAGTEIAAEKNGKGAVEEAREETRPNLTRIGEEVGKKTVLLHT